MILRTNTVEDLCWLQKTGLFARSGTHRGYGIYESLSFAISIVRNTALERFFTKEGGKLAELLVQRPQKHVRSAELLEVGKNPFQGIEDGGERRHVERTEVFDGGG